jgi:Integrase core domain
VLNKFYRVAFRKKVYRSIDELQADLDCWIKEYNEARPHQGRSAGRISGSNFSGLNLGPKKD